jgi:hypothetical protein
VPVFFFWKICWCEFLSFVVCAVGCKFDEHTKPVLLHKLKTVEKACYFSLAVFCF